MLRPASLCCSLRWCWSCPPACGITPFVFSLTLCCLQPSSPFLVSGFLVVRTFSRISQMLDSDVVFRKGKVHQSFFGKLTTRLALFHPLRSEMLGSRRSLPLQRGSCIGLCVCVPLRIGCWHLCGSCDCVRVHIVLECAILSSGFLRFWIDISAAAAFSDAVTLVSGSAYLSVAVFYIAFATAAAWFVSFRFLCLVRDLVLGSGALWECSGTSVACQL